MKGKTSKLIVHKFTVSHWWTLLDLLNENGGMRGKRLNILYPTKKKKSSVKT